MKIVLYFVLFFISLSCLANSEKVFADTITNKPVVEKTEIKTDENKIRDLEKEISVKKNL